MEAKWSSWCRPGYVPGLIRYLANAWAVFGYSPATCGLVVEVADYRDGRSQIANLAHDLRHRRRGSLVVDVMRNQFRPAWASRATWIAVASASAVSVLSSTGRRSGDRRPPRPRLCQPRSTGVESHTGCVHATERHLERCRRRYPANESHEECEAGEIGPLLDRAHAPLPEHALQDHDHELPPSKGGNGSTLTGQGSPISRPSSGAAS